VRSLLLLAVDALPSLGPVAALTMGRSARRVAEDDESPPHWCVRAMRAPFSFSQSGSRSYFAPNPPPPPPLFLLC
jgi:hypothetical protein